jgi:hypothetical protein
MRHHAALISAVALCCLLLPTLATRCVASTSDKSPAIELDLDFRVDDPTFFAGGPLPFALRVKLAPGARPVTVPEGWYHDARFAWGGAAGRDAVVTTEPTAAMAGREQGASVELKPEKRGDSVYLVIGPQQTATLEPGRHVLRASVDVAVSGDAGGTTTVHLEREAELTIVPASTTEEKSRLSIMTATYQVENRDDLDGAIVTLQNGLRDTGDAELSYRLGWLYQSRGDLEEAIAAYQGYIDWARASGIPRQDAGRGPQEIADMLEQTIATLRQRIDGSADGGAQ